MVVDVTSVLLWIVAAFNICGNLLVLISYWRDHSLREVHNFYIIHLAVCDLAIGAIIMPLQITAYKWNFGALACKATLFLDQTLVAMGALLVLLIGMDRLALLKLGARYNTVETFRKAAIRIGVCLGALVTAHVLCMVAEDLINPSFATKETTCDVNFKHKVPIAITLFVVDFLVPFIGLCIVNVLLFLAIHKRLQITVRAASISLPSHRSSTAMLTGQTRKRYTLSPVVVVSPPVTGVADSEDEKPTAKKYFFWKTCVCPCGLCKSSPSPVPDHLKAYTIRLSNASSVSPVTSAPARRAPSCQPDGTLLLKTPVHPAKETQSLTVIPERSVAKCESSDRVGPLIHLHSTLQGTSAGEPQPRPLTSIEFPSESDIMQDTQARKPSIMSQKSVSWQPHLLSLPESTPAPGKEVHKAWPSPKQRESQAHGQSPMTPFGDGSVITVRRSSILRFQTYRFQQAQRHLRRRQDVRSQEKRVARVLLALTLALLLCWLPYEIASLLGSWCGTCVSSRFYFFSLAILWLKSSVNPILYAANSPTFLKNFTKLLSPLCFCCVCCKRLSCLQSPTPQEGD